MRNPLNSESNFAQVNKVDVARSVIPRNHSWKGSIEVGKLNVVLCDEVLPGDTFNCKANLFMRMASPPIVPVLDDCYIDMATFYVRNSLLWEHWKDFCGERDATHYMNPTTYTLPVCDAIYTGRTKGDLFDQMGVTISVSSQNRYINALPQRAYTKIWNDWFRAEALQDPIPEYTGDTMPAADSTNKINQLLPVGRVHDLYGCCQPSPQLGDAVKVALSGWANVEPSSTHSLPTGTGITYPKMTAMDLDGTAIANAGAIGYSTGSGVVKNSTSTSGTEQIVYNNLIIDGDKATALGVDVRQLRAAVQTQKMLERLSATGNRYFEGVVYGLFGVTVPDSMLGRAELISFSRSHVSMQEVIQQSGTVSGQTPIGYTGAMSKTFDNSHKWNRSFPEHGILITVLYVRHNRSYSQGVNPMFYRKEFLDFYNPVMQCIENMPVYTREIYANDNRTDRIFGYAEPWYSYKTFPSISCGELSANPLASGAVGDIWTYSDSYSTVPTLSASWIEEGSAEFKRTLSDPTGPDFIGEVYFDYECTRPMLMHSSPGLMDHF